MIGSLIGLPIAILFAQILAPLSDIITQYSGLIFTIAACVIAFMSQAKIGAVVALGSVCVPAFRDCREFPQKQ